MKWIHYEAFCGKRNIGTEKEPIYEDILQPTRVGWNEANEETAKREAYNGKYTVDEVDDPDTPDTPTLEDRVDTLETDTADLAEALDMILSEVTE